MPIIGVNKILLPQQIMFCSVATAWKKSLQVPSLCLSTKVPEKKNT